MRRSLTLSIIEPSGGANVEDPVQHGRTIETIARLEGDEWLINMATAAMETIESFRADDEELVAIVENDACGVDVVLISILT